MPSEVSFVVFGYDRYEGGRIPDKKLVAVCSSLDRAEEITGGDTEDFDVIQVETDEVIQSEDDYERL